jgi:hypothetical protein
MAKRIEKACISAKKEVALSGRLTESARSKKAGGLCFLSSVGRVSVGEVVDSNAELIMLLGRKFPWTSERQYDNIT